MCQSSLDFGGVADRECFFDFAEWFGPPLPVSRGDRRSGCVEAWREPCSIVQIVGRFWWRRLIEVFSRFCREVWDRSSRYKTASYPSVCLRPGEIPVRFGVVGR